jgi:DeoR family transcriptional regulator, suf operon transcriptional repressor
MNEGRRMHDTRLHVLEAIKAQRQATVASLADTLGISPISIRHHLSSLEAEGLIQIEIERQGVGRPRHLYSLTEQALRYFPNKYHVLLERLLDEMKATLPAVEVERLIDGLAANVAANYGPLTPSGSLEERLNHLITVLGAEGFMAEVQHIGTKTVLTELNCPYLYVGQRHPEICRIDHTLIRSVLGVGVEQTACVLHGDHACTFTVNDSVNEELPVKAG